MNKLAKQLHGFRAGQQCWNGPQNTQLALEVSAQLAGCTASRATHFAAFDAAPPAAARKAGIASLFSIGQPRESKTLKGERALQPGTLGAGPGARAGWISSSMQCQRWKHCWLSTNTLQRSWLRSRQSSSLYGKKQISCTDCRGRSGVGGPGWGHSSKFKGGSKAQLPASRRCVDPSSCAAGCAVFSWCPEPSKLA